MKFLPYIFLISLIMVASIIVINQPQKVYAYEYDYFRLHIVANSNSTNDQELKYLVKSKLIDFYTPYLADVDSKDEAIRVVNENLDVASLLINKSLQEIGVTYGAELQVKQEQFPTRYYENFCLEEGVYDSIIIKLGKGEGDNWWCVVYPPLCFLNKNAEGAQDIIYKSKFLEIIEKYFR